VALLRALTAGWQPDDGRTLFLVGDPMQSIYRFRNAEVGLFLEIRDHGLGELKLESLSLGVNFRSTAPLVSWVNEAFSQALPPRDDALKGAVRFAPATAPDGADTDGGVRVHPLFRRSRELEARRVVEIVTGRLEQNSDARIAVLVQARSHLVEIAAALTRAGVAFQATDVDALGERPAVLDLLSLTRALAHPADRAAWLAVLRAPWCGLTLAELHAVAGGTEEAAVLDQLRDPTRLSRLPQAPRQRLQRTLRVMEDALGELRRRGLRDSVERASIALGGPATVEERSGLAETQAYLDALAAISDGEDQAIRLATLAEALEELYAPSPSRPEVRVEMMTIHKAKGLQFDTVILPGLDRAPGRDRGRLLHWMKLPEVDGAGLVVAPLAQTGAEANALHAWLGRIEAERLQQERRRLLYVAATRAERWLHLLGSCRLKDEQGSQRLLPPGESCALGMLWPVVGEHYAQRLQQAGSIEGEAVPVAARDPLLRRLPAGWRPPPAPPGPDVEPRVRRSAGEIAPVVFDWATQTARHVGTLVHRELQRIAACGQFPGPNDPGLRGRYARELAELGVPANMREEAIERCRTALALAIEDPRGRWLLDGSHREAASELALSGPLDGELVSVVIDRTFIDPAGTRWVIDYKTSTHEGAALEGFLDSEQQRYREQLERYASLVSRLGPEPVKVALYFPLLRAWREWWPRTEPRDPAGS
jgi:ATP-dependent exoDNAse (exonuclease V) beta subunit